MKIIDKLNMFIKNMTQASTKAEENPSSSLDICDMPVQQEEFSKVDEDDNLVKESHPLEEEQSVPNAIGNTLDNECESTEFVEPTSKSPSLLDNSEYMVLAQQCCDMLMELDRMQSQIKNEEVLDFIALQKSRIREALVLSGASLIAEESEFNMLRHQCVSGGMVKNGTHIVETVEAGVEIGGRVMKKGLVRMPKITEEGK